MNTREENEKLRALLREIRPTIPRDVLELWCKDRDSALSQQAEPVEPAPAQDEREAFEVEIPDIVGVLYRSIVDESPRIQFTGDQEMLIKDGDAVMTVAQHLRIEKQLRAALTRPAQTEQQPEQSGLVGQVCGGDGTHNTVNVAVVGPVPWGDLRIGTPVRLIPAPATPSPATDADK